MGKKQFELWFYDDKGNFLESRQCSHDKELQALFEAVLYKDWAIVHYGCKDVTFKITER